MGLTAEAYQRMQMALLPPGKVWRFVGGLITKLFLGAADELARFDQRCADLLRESHPSTAVELLPEYEADFALPSTGTNGQRQARIVALEIALQGYKPSDFQAALAPIFGQLPADVVIIETSPAVAASMGDVREVFRFFAYRDPGLGGTYSIDDAQALIDTIKPSHTAGYAIESVDFLCDDPFSLCDRDLLGA